MLHDRRPDQKDHYEQTIGKQTTLWNSKGDDTPRIEVRQDVKFAVWKMFKHYHTESSAWNSLDDYVKGPGWRAPIHPNKPVMELEGNWAAFTSWFLDNYGHFSRCFVTASLARTGRPGSNYIPLLSSVHDHLATIAYLRSVVPASTGFLLVDCPVSRKVIKFIDEEFYNRIKWIGRDELYHIKGTLTVAVPVAIPIAFGCCGGFDPMRQWIAEKHPDRPEKKLIVYYSRGGSTDTTHGRVIHPDLDKQIIEHIKAKMEQYGKKEDFVIFNGQYKGKTMPIEMQYAVFRSASTIIGPHGSGLGGNFVWTNPFARTCEERTQLLEFIPGQESAQVQILYATYVSDLAVIMSFDF
jgi:hypothetical protein